MTVGALSGFGRLLKRQRLERVRDDLGRFAFASVRWRATVIPSRYTCRHSVPNATSAMRAAPYRRALWPRALGGSAAERLGRADCRQGQKQGPVAPHRKRPREVRAALAKGQCIDWAIVNDRASRTRTSCP